MQSIFSNQLQALYTTIGLPLPEAEEQIARSIRVNGEFSVQLVEFPLDHLVLACELDHVAAELAPLLLTLNRADADVHPYVVAMSEQRRLVLWRRVPFSTVDERGLYPVFDEFTEAIEKLQALVRDAGHVGMPA